MMLQSKRKEQWSFSGSVQRAGSLNPQENIAAIEGLVLVEDGSIGKATLQAGTTSIAVRTPASTSDSTVLLTPLAPFQTRLSVTPTHNGFLIKAGAAPVVNIDISYLIIKTVVA
jgi:hypothetical protein